MLGIFKKKREIMLAARSGRESHSHADGIIFLSVAAVALKWLTQEGVGGWGGCWLFKGEAS